MTRTRSAFLAIFVLSLAWLAPRPPSGDASSRYTAIAGVAPIAVRVKHKQATEMRVHADPDGVTSGAARQLSQRQKRWYEIERATGGWFSVDVIREATITDGIVDFRDGNGGHVVELVALGN